MERRSSSLPPRANQFWSAVVQHEWLLRHSRPGDLPPVPGDDEEVSRELEGPPLADRSLPGGVNRGRSGREREEPFRTPESWEMPSLGRWSRQEGRRTAGLLPEESPEVPPVIGSQGPQPTVEDDGLQRAIEQELFDRLQEENAQLIEEVRRLRSQRKSETTSVSQWSEVSGSQPQPPPLTPARKEERQVFEEERFTPNGTRIPSGPPPSSPGGEIPSWPLDGYERVDVDRVWKDFGSEVLLGESSLRDRSPRRGARSSRHEGCDRGAMGPRQGQVQQETRKGETLAEVLTGVQARALWLERELVSMKAALNRQEVAGLKSDYWKKPVDHCGRTTREGEAEHGGLQDSAPLGRAVHGEHREHVPLCRANRAEQVEQAPLGRAFLSEHHEGDRAWQGKGFGVQDPHDKLCHDGLDRVHGGDSLFGGSYHEDRHGHQQQHGRDGSDPRGEKPDRERSPQEALRTSNPELPKLPEQGQKNSSVDASDWLVEIRPVISDISTRAGRWWTATMDSTMNVYQEWLAADPLTRLRLQPPQPVRDPSLGNPQIIERLEQRVTTILLPALPIELRRDLVANRQLWPGAVIFRVLRTYQPGGWGEKASVLQELTSPASAETPSEASSKLRMWRRQKARAEELKATLPDVMLQVQALETIVQKVIASHQQVSFRISTFRMYHKLDINPSQTSLMEFLELLTAEMDSLVNLSSSSLVDAPTSTSTSSNPRTKALTTSPNATRDKVDLVCRFWGTNNGCHHAKNCRFQHKELEDKHNRCWHCSATTHQRAECPYYGHPGSTPQDGGSEAGGLGKAKDGKRGEGKSKKGNKSNIKGGKPNATSNNVQEGRGKGNGTTNGGDNKGKGGEEKPSPTVAKEQVLGSAEGNPATEQQPATGETSNSSAALEKELTSLLRSLRTEATIRAYSIQKMVPGDGREARVLIDGGATHCLRTCVDEKEWLKAGEIRVMLAEGETTMRQVAETKTLVTKEHVQAIIPMALVTAVGYQVHWTNGQRRITHPGRQDLPVKLEDGCPTIPMDVGMQLFQEVEAHQRQRHQVRAILAGEDRGQSARHQQLQELKGLFPGVPLHLLQRVPGAGTWDASKLPFNRRRRRQLESAKHLVIYAFSGPNEAEWKRYETDQVTVLCLDSLVGVNLLDDNVAAWLEHLLQSRDVDLWLSSPPCKTVSVCRQHDGGPPPLRNDDPIERFGFRDLSPHHRTVVDDDTTLWLRNLYWMWLASKRNKRLQALIEQPRDPREWRSGQAERGELDDQPSFLRWPETKRITEDLNLKPIHLEQGALGHLRPKPTTLLSSIPATWSLQGLCCSQPHEKRAAWPSELKDKIKLSQSLAAWAPGLKQLLQKVISNIGSPKDRCPELHKLSGAELAELKAWEDHVRAGHSPYRKDCAICVESRGRDRPHHRQKTVDGFCLSLDISGPYEPGFDQHVDKPRYYITGVVTVPTVGENPLVEGLRALGMQQRAQEGGTPPMAPNSGDGGSHSTAIAGQEDGDADKAENLLEEAQIKAARRAPPRTVDVEDPFEPREPPTRECQGLSEAEVQECDLMDEKWREHLLDKPRVEVANLTQTLPLRSRNARDVVQATGLIYTRLRSLGIPVMRVHHDRAKEFLSSEFKRWIAVRDLLQSTTAGDEPQTNGRVEAELNVVRGLARTYLKSASLPNSYWPLAIRAASESRFRAQLRGFGLQVPDIIPFGCRALAQQKRWHRTSDWQAPSQMVTLLGPAADMTMTSGGYFAELPNGKFIRTTAIVVPKFMSKGEEVQSMQVMPPDTVNPQLQDAQPQDALDFQADVQGEGGSILGAHGQEAQRGEEEPLFNPEAESLEVVTQLELAILPDVPARQQPEVSNKPRRKIIGKQTAVPYANKSPALLRFALSAGGEWQHGSGDGSDQDEAFWTTQKRLHDECEAEQHLMLLQHRAIGEVIQEMASFVMEDGGQECEMGLVRKLHQERSGLEARLKVMQAVEEEVQQEVLQTKTVSTQELRRDPDPWYEPFKDEYDNLVRTVIKPLNGEQTKELINNSEKVERVPGKVVATIKPPFKRRGRIVACGNFAATTSDFETAASAIDTISVRAVLRLAADRQWQVSSTDIKQAFLNAPRLEKPKCTTLVDPPQFLRDLQVVAPNETWQVVGALYGFSESPRDWGLHRDRVLAKKRWTIDNTVFYLKETNERHLWELKSQAAGEGVVTRGYVCIYVDDILVTADAAAANSFLDALQTVWECSPPETATVDKAMKFCGYEIQALPGGGLKLGQPSFVQELINKHNVTGEENTAAPKISNPPDEDYDIQTLRTAQGLTGELQWIQSRTRPDLCYIVGCMSRWLHRKPGFVISLAQHTLRYLRKTKNYWLHYEPAKKDDWGEDQVLHRPRAMDQLEVYVDTSFGLEHEQSRSVQGVLIEQAGSAIMWTSGRQPFIAASTGEAELLGYSEGHQEAESVGSLLGELGMDLRYILYGDCRAALSLASTDSGTWRTRHLRLRAHRLREALRYSNVPHEEDESPKWIARHLDGHRLVADGLTKSLQGALFQKFVSRLGLHDSVQCRDQETTSSIKKVQVQLEEKWRKLIGLGALMWKSATQRLQRLGLGLLSAVLWILKKQRRTGNGEGDLEEQPRLCAFRPASQLPVRPARQPLQSQAASRGQAAVAATGATELEEDRAGGEVPEWWSFPELQGAPRGKDRWMTLRNKWLIRVHGEERRRVFQPIHRSCPVDGARLKSKRTSVVYPVDGRTERCIKHDQWTSSSWTMNYRWVGYTVFEIVDEEEIELTGTQQVPNQSSSSTTFSSTAASGVEPPMPARNVDGYEGHSVVVNNQPVIHVTVTVSGRDRPFSEEPAVATSLDSSRGSFEMVSEDEV